MLGLENLFIVSSPDVAYLYGAHDPWLVVLSIMVAILSSTMALQTANIANLADKSIYRQFAVVTGSIALGGGIWTMHFIGMLSFQICAQISYHPGFTLLSFLPGWAASWVVLQTVSRPDVTPMQLLGSGILVGLGIGAMHYGGMAAMQMEPVLRYDPATFAASVVVAIALAIPALWIQFGLQKLPLRPLYRLLISGAIMGLAISGMHYTGMLATRFIGEPEDIGTQISVNNTFASLMLSAFTIMVTVLVTAANGVMRYRQILRKMRESESRIRAIVDTAVDGIITINSNGIVQTVNGSVERLFGWKPEEIIGRNISMLMPEPDRSRHDSYLRNHLSTGVARIIGIGRDITGQRKDGSLIPLRLAVGRVQVPGDPLFVGFVTDSTHHRNLENSLRDAAERAEQAAAAKSTFLANMSHEIRTPMNAIIGFTELLLKDDITALQRSHLNTIRQSSRSLLGLLNGILDTTKLEKGSVELETLDFSLKKLAAQIVASLHLGARAKGLELSMDYPETLGEYFKGDPLRIRQILTNLVSNAIKFTECGAVTLSFRQEKGQEKGYVVMQVQDTGIGMTTQQLEAIFAPFTQADASISRRFGGTGLGTTIARQLVELMGGDIRVESHTGKGSTFMVRLPLVPGETPVPREDHAINPALPPLDILIADDVAENLELLTMTLHDGGHRVFMASDGEQAVNQFRARRYHVVLMDVHMPAVDGLEATRRIRQHEMAYGLTPTPIIALTASVMVEDERAAMDSGMNGFAVKPLDVPKLMAEIARVLNVDVNPATIAGAQGHDGQTSLIHWSSGQSLWGSHTRLAKALDGFLSTLDERYPLPSAIDDTTGWDKLAFSLHGIRGATGNLALPTVSALAGALGKRIGDGERNDILPRLQVLKDMLATARNELHASSAFEALSLQQAPPTPLLQDLQKHIRDLITYLANNELDTPALLAISEALRAQGQYGRCNSLNAAIDAFEFDKAIALLNEIQSDHMSPSPQYDMI